MKCTQCKVGIDTSKGYFSCLADGRKDYHLYCKPQYYYYKEQKDDKPRATGSKDKGRQ